jgi:uncharacterized protein (TIGR01777 family)
MPTFTRQCDLPVSVTEAFAWHERPGALDRLMPPWERVEILERGDGIRAGSRVLLVNRFGPLRLRWLAEHTDYQPPHLFRDVQARGPFARWDHIHRMESQDTGSRLTDTVDYQIPGGHIGRWLMGRFIQRKIERMFTYRHETTAADLAAQAKFKEFGSMHVAVTGASGLVGSTLVPLLTTAGHSVTRLVRRSAAAGEVHWDPQADAFDAGPLDGTDAIVHLAGKGIASGRWTAKTKQAIRDSRVRATRVFCEGLAKMPSPPRVLVSASAIGYYGNRGDELLTESSTAGNSFLSEVARDWELATKPASDAGIRVVLLRFGIILSPRDGALAKMLTPFKLGVGGVVGSGRQYWSWIGIDDAAGAIQHALLSESIRGPVNVVAPQAATNREFTRVLGRVLNRPTYLPMPGFAARLALGEMANELLLASTRVVPQRLLDTGYEFRHADLEAALRHLLGKK